MKNKLFLLIATSFLLIGCNTKKSETSSFDSSENSSSEEQSGYGYDYYGGYYGELKWDNGEDLKNKLHTIIRTGYQPIRYVVSSSANWESNIDADKSENDYEYLDVVYSPDNVYSGYSQTSWQREHVFPATLMTDSQTSNAVKFLGRATDFHNLYAGGAGGNMSRKNKNYGVVDKSDPTKYTDRTVDDGYDGYSFDEKTFEPGNKDKGRLARAIFYMATMYKDDEYDDVNDKNMEGLTIVEENVDYDAGGKFAIGHLSELLTWNNSWNVDYLEMQHNESVYSHVFSKDNKAQGNRNPFVDYPTLVDFVYGDKQNQAGDLNNEKPSCYDLETESTEFSHYAIGSAKREYNLGESLSSSDFSIYQVNKNYTHSIVASSEYTHSLIGHTFVKSDGDEMTAEVVLPNQTLFYKITINNMTGCTYYSNRLNGTASQFTNGKAGDQNISWNSTQFTVNIVGDNDYRVTNSNTMGGITIGSSTSNRTISKVTITTVKSYTVDEVFVDCCAANKSSSFSLTVKVGETVVYSSSIIYNADSTIIHGGSISSATGKITYIFSGSNSLLLGALAFNVVE
jgi:endonuclease I